MRTRKEPFPWAPLVATLLIPAALIALVKFGYPHLWAGFQEHARQTPSVLGWRWPRMDEGLKVLRTGPGVWGVAVAAILMGLRNRQRLTERLASLPALVALGGAAAVAGIVLAALIYLTPNFALSIGYLQPLVVGGFLTAYGGEWLARGQRRFLIWAFVLLAAVGAVRAVGMSTWGIACAVDVSHAQGMQRAREALDRTPAGTTVVVSAAFLYEAARHQDLRAIHSDWLAPGHHPEPLINLIIKHRPARLILTQFDYYRHFEGAVQQLQARDRQVEVKTDNAAKIRVPDASRQLQRVVQHISWAPVIVELNWH